MPTTFRINPEPTFRVTVEIPAAGMPDQELDVEFRRKTKDELVAFFSSFAGRNDGDILMEIVSGWHNCETPFSKEALEAVMQTYPAAGKAILAKYGVESTGARLGN